MRKLFTILTAVTLSASVFAQAPNLMGYQAVVRDAGNNLVTSHAVGMRISILQGSASGTAVYVETQTPASNTNGLVSIEIGGGIVVSGIFDSIRWANGPYFIQTETDPTGSTNYSITGISQILSVPYALFAASGNYNNLTNLPVGSSAGNTPYWNGTQWVLNSSNIYNNGGNIGINDTTPVAKLQVTNGSVLFDGSTDTTPTSGAGTRMMWVPAKGALRAGTVTGSKWDDANIGSNSFAFGYDAEAGGEYSIAVGYQAEANGYWSVALGYSATASASVSAAIGEGATASGIASTSIGNGTTATGWYSTALGTNTTAQAYDVTVLGQYNVIAGTIDNWVSTDPLLVVGNGTYNTPSNALTVLKNGNTSISGDMSVQNSMGLIRNNSVTQLKMVTTNVTVNPSPIGAGASIEIGITWSESFSSPPVAYVGNCGGTGGWAEVIMSISSITTTGATLWINNPKSVSDSPNFNVNIIAIGAE